MLPTSHDHIEADAVVIDAPLAALCRHACQVDSTKIADACFPRKPPTNAYDVQDVWILARVLILRECLRDFHAQL